MNRSILIVICDFLLVSLVTFSSVDLNKVTEEGTPLVVKTSVVTTNQPDSSRNDLASVMRLALDEERRDRERLVEDLLSTRQAITNRDSRLQDFVRRLQASEQTNEQLRSQEAALRKEQQDLQGQYGNLARQFAAAQTNIHSLTDSLRNTSSEASASRTRLEETAAELRRQTEQANALQQQLVQMQHSNQVVQAEKQQISTQLKVAEAQKQLIATQVAKMEEQVKVEKAEKAKLADNVQQLATRSGALEEEIRENRPLAANRIFSDFLTNRVSARFIAFRSGLIDTTRRGNTESIIVNQGNTYFAVCHARETPLNLTESGSNWERISGTLSRNNAELPIRSVAFYFEDPRVVLIPLSQEEAQHLGAKAYRISQDPFKFQDAVLVGAREGYYGECKFQIDPSTPEYVRLDRNFLKGIFGQFNPSRGDLVFSKAGELLGIMANNAYCLKLRDFNSIANIQFGDDVRAQRTGETLAKLSAVVSRKPQQLQ